MRFLKNLQAAAEFLFFLFGGLFLLAFMFHRNNFHTYEAEMFMRLGDVPFALICLVFMISSLRLSFNEQMSSSEHKEDELVDAPLLDAILIVVGLVLFLAVLFLNFAFPDLA